MYRKGVSLDLSDEQVSTPVCESVCAFVCRVCLRVGACLCMCGCGSAICVSQRAERNVERERERERDTVGVQGSPQVGAIQSLPGY
jgi:hypothetical protein